MHNDTPVDLISDVILFKSITSEIKKVLDTPLWLVVLYRVHHYEKLCHYRWHNVRECNKNRGFARLNLTKKKRGVKRHMEKNRIRPIKSGKNSRMSYSRQKEVLQMPNLIEVQKASYPWFLDEG